MLSHAKKIAVIGAGGKTTLLGLLSENRRDHRVLLTTTTHICPVYPPQSDRFYASPSAEELRTALSTVGITCAGTMHGDRKLSSLPEQLLTLAAAQADYIFYEADGAHCLPLKLHTATEPVILPDTLHCVIVAGLSALGKPLSEYVHRYTLRPDWVTSPNRPIDFEIIAACVLDAARASGLSADRLSVLLNQADACSYPCDALVDYFDAQGLRCTVTSLQTDGLPDFLAAL